MQSESVSKEAGEPEHRWQVLHDLEDWLETPMLVLSFIWVMLVVVELLWGASGLLEVFGTSIWLIFLLEFLLRLTLAPDKLVFLANNWLTLASLVVPAFRLFRAFRLMRVARTARSLRLVRIVGTANRGMNALRRSLGRRGLGYVLFATVFTVLLGAAGMLAFEPASEVPGGFASYADALWWTAMLLTSIGSQYWPATAEGRILCLLLSIYGFTVFGYITASFASFFVGQEARLDDGELPGPSDLRAIRDEMHLLRQQLKET